MKESEIRNEQAHRRYLELAREDAMRIFHDKGKFLARPCPACGSEKSRNEFAKDDFRYVSCTECKTLFVSPQPPYEMLAELYDDSESTRFWVDEFFTPQAENRRVKIFRPRATYIAKRLPDLSRGKVADIGAGFGLFGEELRAFWPESEFHAIEPSRKMAEICEKKNFRVIRSMLEDIHPSEHSFDLLTSFELLEHLHDPLTFLTKAARLLKENGWIFLTTLNGMGFDIQTLWNKSRSVMPPHHLNFLNTDSVTILLRRAGLESVEVSTPGKLDVEIVRNSAPHEDSDVGRFFSYVMKNRSESCHAEFQGWLQKHLLSSHMWVLARKRN
ncbi:MAG TPA: class I SAM-dependent methyltransferase [Bdellovibrionota bacterium]|nr:class I SAM-dependent methyltransferase [Bdellovibrionota bacterium]